MRPEDSARKLSERLHRLARGWITLGALITFLLFSALVLPAQSRLADEQSGGAGSPDTSLLYRPADLYRMAEAYGEAGRESYIRARFTFDLVWPIVYGLFLITSIGWLYGRTFPAGSSWRLVNLVPLAGMVFDYLENVSAALVMARYPATTPVVDWLAPAFTPVKWLFVGGSFVLMVAGLLLQLRLPAKNSG